MHKHCFFFLLGQLLCPGEIKKEGILWEMCKWRISNSYCFFLVCVIFESNNLVQTCWAYFTLALGSTDSRNHYFLEFLKRSSACKKCYICWLECKVLHNIFLGICRLVCTLGVGECQTVPGQEGGTEDNRGIQQTVPAVDL